MKERSSNVGCVSVRLVSARNLKAIIPSSILQWRNGSANPYGVIRVGSNQQQTPKIENTLTPQWDRQEYEFELPLPSELDNGTSENDSMQPKKFYRFDPQFPEVLVQIHHHPLGDEDQDVCIGQAIVAVLPTIQSRHSSMKKWVTLYDEDIIPVGEVQLVLHYHPSGLEPRPGDIIRMTNFGGSRHYQKVVPPGVRMQVLKVRGEDIFATYTSPECWQVKLQLHRNLIYVVHRPNLLASATSNINNKIEWLRNSRAGHQLERAVERIPEKQRNQLLQGVSLLQFLSARVWDSCRSLFSSYQRHGVQNLVDNLSDEARSVFDQVRDEMYAADWSGQVNPVVAGQQVDRKAIMSEQQTKVQELAQEGVNSAEHVPDELICPITGCPMIDPVVAADGHSYDRVAILQWFATNNTSPMTGTIVSTKQVFPNFALQKLAEQYMKN